MSPETFNKLLEHIENHPVFISEGSANQMPVGHQLAIALFWFGHYGNAASVESIEQWADVSAGMVVNTTCHVMIAFLALHDDVICWPSAKEKEAAKEWVEAASCAAWRNGWILVDGTLMPLAEKPAYHEEAYFDRKSNYSLNVQVHQLSIISYNDVTDLFSVQLITLPNLQIVDYVIGHCGSTHDSTAFNDSCTLINHQQLLGPGEWIWADSAYPIEAWCVTPYKKPASNISDNKTFNFWVSHVCICFSESCLHKLQGLYSSLRSAFAQSMLWVT